MSLTLKPRTIDVVLLQGDDAARAEELLAALEQSVASSPQRVGDDTPAHVTAAREYDEFMDSASERAVTLTVQALPRRRYRELLAEHPPRDGDDRDKAAGFNVEAFADALVPEAIVTEFPSLADRDALLDSLSDGQWQRLASAAVAVNQGGQPNPKARLSSALQASDETSESPDRLA